MSYPHIIPVVMCGGKGSRLWPLSTPDKPKVFHCLTGPYSLFQETLLRCRDQIFAKRPIIVGSVKHQELIADQLNEVDIDADILLEPCGRDSLPAALVGALSAQQRRPNAMILLLAADHFIPDVQAFVETIVQAYRIAETHDCVVFGVEPEGPSEAFGYIKPGARLEGGAGFEFLQFKEKPQRVLANQLVSEGWLWNSGNFLCNAERLLKAASMLAPDVLVGVEQSLLLHDFIAGAKIVNAKHFSALKPQSFDRAILENLASAAVFPVSYKWRDLGTWDAIIAYEAEKVTLGLAGVNHNGA